MSDPLTGRGRSGGGFGDDAGPGGGAGRRSGRRRPGRAAAGGDEPGADRPDDAAPGRRGGRGGRGGRSSGPQWSRNSAPADEAAEPAEMEDPETVARGICLRALTGTAKTRKQLADLLATKGVPDEAAAAVLDRFTEVGLIDDAAFAAAWVTSRQSGRGLARRALSAELRAKGVDGDLAAAAVAEVDPQDEWDSARALVARKVPAMRRLDRVTAERRLMGMLARKGYGGGLAGFVVREALDADGAAEDAAAEAEPLDPATGAAATSEAPPAGGSSSGGSSFGSRGPGRSRSSFGSGAGGAKAGSSWSSGAGRSARQRAAAAAEAEAEADEPVVDPDAPAPVPWSRERSAARAAARALAEAAGAAGGADVSDEVGEGRARPIGRLRPPPGSLPVDDLL